MVLGWRLIILLGRIYIQWRLNRCMGQYKLG
jgi:hypothetical protein